VAHSIKSRFRIVDHDGTIVMGPGKADLLDAIARSGSIRAAAEELEMSYMRAWTLVKTMNAAFRSPLVEKERGGSAQGGAQLTARGKTVLELYRAMEEKAERAIKPEWTRLRRQLAAVAVAVVLAFASCKGGGDSSPAGPDGHVPFTTVHTDMYSGIRTPRAELISRADIWQRTWDEIVSGRSPAPPLPAVDFNTNILIFVALGQTADSCKRIAVENVERRDGELLVRVKETRPPASCSCPPVVVNPVHVVSIPRAATGAVFEHLTVTEGAGCN
jgi:molybdate transport system regulatory protein